MMVKDKNGSPINKGDLVQQVIWDTGEPIPDEYLPAPRLVKDVGMHHYCVYIEGRHDWQAGTQFVKISEQTDREYDPNVALCDDAEFGMKP